MMLACLVAQLRAGHACPLPLAVGLPANRAISTSWSLYEVEAGRHRITHIAREQLPVRVWVEKQGRFRHLLADEAALASLQAWVDADWERLVSRAGGSKE